MMGNGEMDPTFNEKERKSYVLSGRIMLSAIVILFVIVILMICLHLYIRWFHLQARRRHLRRRQRRSHLVFYDDPATTVVATSRGLDPSVLVSLPVFFYSSKAHPHQIECPACLSEFEDGETGRVLPKCNHSFHVDCIDMWFKTHSTCPNCRAAVEPAPGEVNRSEVVINVSEPDIPDTESVSGMCLECENEGRDEIGSGNTVCSSSSSIGLGRKPLSLVGVTLEVPKRSLSFGEELTQSSSVRSPMSRMLSFKRMLSRDRKASLSPSAGPSTAAHGNDIEKDGGEGGGGNEGDVAVS